MEKKKEIILIGFYLESLTVYFFKTNHEFSNEDLNIKSRGMIG